MTSRSGVALPAARVSMSSQFLVPGRWGGPAQVTAKPCFEKKPKLNPVKALSTYFDKTDLNLIKTL